jgi:hypothetical protein
VKVKLLQVVVTPVFVLENDDGTLDELVPIQQAPIPASKWDDYRLDVATLTTEIERQLDGNQSNGHVAALPAS